MSLIPSFFDRRSNVFNPFSLEVWDPFEGWPTRPFFDQLRSSFPSKTSSFAHTNIDWKETMMAHVFKVDVLRLKKKEVKVEIKDRNVLHIIRQRNREQEEKTNTWHRIEGSSGSFARRFRLPENVKVDKVKAAMEDPILTVTVLMEELKKIDVRSTEISG